MFTIKFCELCCQFLNDFINALLLYTNTDF